VTLLHGVLFGQSAPVPMLPDYGIAPVAPPSVYTSPALHNDPYPYSIPAAESLLRAHGWAKNSSGVDVCQRSGTASNACGYWWQLWPAAFFIVVTVLAVSVLGHGLRDMTEGRPQRR
jgi:hypothetical protein